MSEENQFWMIKDGSGRIRGPYNTKKVLELIRTFELSGEETIALYPSGEWIPISKRPEFYDLLIEALTETARPHPPQPENIDIPNIDEKTPTPAPSTAEEPEPSQTEVVSGSENLKVDWETPAKEAKGTPLSSPTTKKQKPPPTIELTNIKEQIEKEKKKKARLSMIFTLVVGIAGVALILLPPSQEHKLRLIVPKRGRPEISPQEAQKKLDVAMAEFSKDVFSSYRKAMNILVQVIEGMPRSAGAYQMLCMTYRELWPFTMQDSKDQAAIEEVTRMAQMVDPGGKFSATCMAVRSLLEGRLSESKSKVENLLENGATDAVLFELKGSILGGGVESIVEGDYESGLIYMDKAIQFWPQWLKPRVVSSVFLWRKGEIGQAITRLMQVLDINPGHVVARAIYGLIQYKALSKNEIAMTQLLQVANSNQIPRILLSEVNLALAEIYAARGESQNAVKYAKVSHQLNPNNRQALTLIRKFGENVNTKKDAEMVGALYVGDQFFARGNYLAAQAEYKTAFEANPKNALAALKAAQALWKLGQSQEAMDFLSKAIKVNPKWIEPYVQQAEYYTERFDYVNAMALLNKAQAIDRNSFEVFRGLAQVELKRGNAQGAISYCQMALKYNPMDVASHVVMAKAYLMAQNISEAYKYAGKSIELENSSYETQDIYARALGKAQGIEAAFQYVRGLIEAYPKVLGYRKILADLLFEEERFADAEKVYKQITDVEPTMKDAFWGLGKSLQAQGKFQDAVDPLLKAATLDTADANSWFLLAQLYAAGGQPEKAFEEYEKVIKRNPLFPQVYLMRGRLALQAGNLDLALSDALKEQNNNPLNFEAIILAAEAYSQQGRYTQCANEIRKAVKLGPVGAKMYVILARCNRLAGDLDAALSMIRLAEERESGLPEVYLELGLIYEAKGDGPLAVEAFNKYLALSPNGKDAETVRQKINQLDR